MKVADALEGVATLFLDTAPIIYFVERHPSYSQVVDRFFDAIDADALSGVTS